MISSTASRGRLPPEATPVSDGWPIPGADLLIVVHDDGLNGRHAIAELREVARYFLNAHVRKAELVFHVIELPSLAAELPSQASYLQVELHDLGTSVKRQCFSRLFHGWCEFGSALCKGNKGLRPPRWRQNLARWLLEPLKQLGCVSQKGPCESL